MVAPIAFVFTGALALACVAVSMRDRVDVPTRTLFAAVSMVTWGVWAFQAKGVTRATGAADPVAEPLDGLFWVGIMLFAVMLLVSFQLALATLVAEGVLDSDSVPGGFDSFTEDS